MTQQDFYNSRSKQYSTENTQSNSAIPLLDLRHWCLLIDADNIAWLTLDRQNAKINSLDDIVFNELSQALLFIMQHKPLGVVIASAKKKWVYCWRGYWTIYPCRHG